MFIAECDRLKSLSVLSVGACWLSEGHVCGVNVYRNQQEAKRANELGIIPATFKAPEDAVRHGSDSRLSIALASLIRYPAQVDGAHGL